MNIPAPNRVPSIALIPPDAESVALSVVVAFSAAVPWVSTGWIVAELG
jgi:hypothetical protein